MNTHPGKTLALLTAIALLAACGGGGGGNGGGATPPVNSPPVASFTATPASGAAPLTVQFDASASSDPGGSIASYNWVFGDNTATGSGVTVSHVYHAVGTFTATLTVTDNLGATATHSVQMTASPIQVTVTVENSVGGLVGDSVPAVASVRSMYEVRDVIATLAGRQTALTYDPQRANFWGTLSLAGEPYGSYTLSVRATDLRGNLADDSIVVTHDNPPTLTVVKPADQGVALGTLPIDVRCSDDLPGCVVEVTYVPAPGNSNAVVRAPAAVATTLDLTSWIGSSVTLQLKSYDSSGQSSWRNVWVYVESPARLAIATEVPGTILDADATRLLFKEPQTTGDRLAIYDRVTNLTATIPLPSGMEVVTDDSYLTPSGAAFFATDAGRFDPPARLYVWRQGALSEVRQASPVLQDTLRVSGNYAVWRSVSFNIAEGVPGLYRTNTATGVTTLVTTDVWLDSAADVAADGTIAFQTLYKYTIVRDRDGQQTILANDPNYWHMYPLIDGDQILYLRYALSSLDSQIHYSIVLIEGADLIPLRDNPDRPLPGTGYQLNSGWTAYTDLGTQQQTHVFTRSPQGAVTRHTDFFTSSHIDGLGDTGDVMIINGQKRYFSRGLGPVEVSSAAGEPYWLNGAWYIAIGTALLAVNTGN